MSESHLERRFRLTSEALENTPMMGARFSPQQLYLMAVALDNWLVVPDIIPNQQEVMEVFYQVATNIYRYLEAKDPRLVDLSDLGNKWCFMHECEGGKAIIESVIKSSRGIEKDREERDYVLEVLSTAIARFLNTTCRSELGMESPWSEFELELKTALRHCLKEPLPFDHHLDPSVNSALTRVEREFLNGSALKQSA